MSMSGLNVIEAARISAVVEEALEKLSFLASITPDVMAHRDELSQIVGDEITRIIQEQRSLETQYEHLIGQRTALKGNANKTKFNDNQEQVKEVARKLRESTKELCRNLKGNPNIAENLTKIQTERSNLQNLLSKTLRELRECSFATLTTTVEEEKARNDMIKEVVQKEKEVSAAVKKLQSDLANEKQLHVMEVEERLDSRRREKRRGGRPEGRREQGRRRRDHEQEGVALSSSVATADPSDADVDVLPTTSKTRKARPFSEVVYLD